MTLLVDAAPLVALANRRDDRHHIVRETLSSWRGPLVVPAPVSAEVGYLLGHRLGRDAPLQGGAFRIVPADPPAGA